MYFLTMKEYCVADLESIKLVEHTPPRHKSPVTGFCRGCFHRVAFCPGGYVCTPSSQVSFVGRVKSDKAKFAASAQYRSGGSQCQCPAYSVQCLVAELESTIQCTGSREMVGTERHRLQFSPTRNYYLT